MNIIKYIASSLLVVGLTACGGGDSGSNSDETESKSLSIHGDMQVYYDSSLEPKTYADAFNYCTTLEYDGYNDWTLLENEYYIDFGQLSDTTLWLSNSYTLNDEEAMYINYWDYNIHQEVGNKNDLHSFICTRWLDSTLNVIDYDLEEDIPEYTIIEAGILNENTTYTMENSPYMLDGNIQVNRGVTMSIDPGVMFKGGSIEVFGSLSINGEADNNVILKDVKISADADRYDDTNPKPQIKITDMNMNGGGISPRNAILSLKNSIIKDTEYMYIWYPEDDCYIEKNVFENAQRISIGFHNYYDTGVNTKIYIRNNVFKNTYVENWANYGDRINNLVVQYNSFLSTGQKSVALEYSSGAMNAKYNFWNTTDTDIIEDMIHDNKDDVGFSMSIEYTPYLTEPDGNTPTLD